MLEAQLNRHCIVPPSSSNISNIVQEIISKRQVTTHFQPIISLKSRSVFGIEALSRGILPTSEIIPPNIMFEQAAALGMTIELDRLCRDKALTAFQPLHGLFPELFLFINFDTTILDKGAAGSEYLINSVLERNLRPDNIVIEMCESRIQNVGLLKEFIQRYKRYGFLLALDDIGIGYSNLDRILLTEPDILKIDRCIVSEINKNFHKQEIFTSIVNMSKKIGALVVAEGIETEAEAITSCELGADLLQGFYFARPKPADNQLIPQTFLPGIDSVSRKFKEHKVAKIMLAERNRQMVETVICQLARKLTDTVPEQFDDQLIEFARHPSLEYLYILNQDGIQVSNSICDSGTSLSGPKKFLFNASNRGADQSLKDYYLYVHAGLAQYITEPYISHASGNLCITVSRVFLTAGQKFILCADFTVTSC